MTLHFQQARARLFNRPLLITPQKARDLVAVLAPRAGLAGRLVDAHRGAVTDLEALMPDSGRCDDRKPYPVADGVAVIEVVGTLVAKLGSLDPWSGMTGYDGLIAKVDAAAADPDVRGILLDVESPGGEVHSSLEECVVAIREAADAKPVWAICSDYAASAAFWIAAQADRVIVPATGEVGSVGVVCMHADFSGALDKEGITVTLIHAGAHKVDGNPYEPLPESVRKDIQRDVDTIHRRFVEAVAEARGLTTEAVRATEARCFMGEGAVEAGFADDVMTPDEAFQAFLAELNSEAAGASTAAAPAANHGKQGKETSMPNQRVAAAQTAATSTRRKAKANTAKSKAADKENEDEANEDEQTPEAMDDEHKDDDTPGAEDEEQKPEAAEDDDEDDGGDGKSASVERKRIAGILNSPEAKGRESLANHLALETGMSVEAAVAALKASPKGGGLAAAMESVGSADVGNGPAGSQPKNHGWDRSIQKVCGNTRKAS